MSDNTHCDACHKEFEEGDEAKFLCGLWMHNSCIEKQGEKHDM